MTRHGFSLADIRVLTAPQARSYMELLADAAAGKTSGGKRYVNQRMKNKRR
ncbi:hypothetical protein [Humidesulfovibrio mexicanus]|uniref:hypothetical protein n=1 Tax=Humidesulfovibrio mexicanus TaxID=147047 RepID=UPI0015C6423D|nr:hypothetical protein [Humidesulfovibrio mexicanus]